jgi:large subunit ribosomal protein L30
MPKKAQKQEKVIRITLVRSPIGYPKPQKDTVKALGLKKMNQTVEHLDSKSLRGMIAKIIHLVKVEE